MINCCSLPSAPEFCFRVPSDYVELLSMLPDYSSCVSGRVNYAANLLHAAPVKHDPYTPDSMDSPSPNAIMTASGYVPDVDVNDTSVHSASQVSNPRRLDRAVSPALLKSKLELIVRNKKQEDDQETNDIKRSPSDYCLRSWPKVDEQEWSVRTNRCNSDVSWQRSHLLTEAWVQGKGQQGYHSFGDFNQSYLGATPPNGVEGLSSDLIIPRISIINASNFESNESSVYMHDDKYVNYPEKLLSTYSDERTKSLSGEAISSERSDDESSRLNETRTGENVYLRNSELKKQDDSTNLSRVEAREGQMLQDREKRLSQILDTLQTNEESKEPRAVSDKLSIKSSCVNSDEKKQTSQVLEQTDAQGKCELTDLEQDEFRKTSPSDDKHEIERSTRSDSVHSQDTSDNPGGIKKLKAERLAESYKSNIVEKKSKCQKCCCVVL